MGLSLTTNKLFDCTESDVGYSCFKIREAKLAFEEAYQTLMENIESNESVLRYNFNENFGFFSDNKLIYQSITTTQI
jgi:hypothetical protein